MTPYTKQIVELHKIHKAIENCGSNKDDEQGGGDENSGSYLMNLIPNNYPKPDLFLCTKNEEDSSVDIDVTNYEIDDLLNLLDEENSRIAIRCLYENSNLSEPIITDVEVGFEQITIDFFTIYYAIDITNDEVVYNNKTYYYYHENVNPK